MKEPLEVRRPALLQTDFSAQEFIDRRTKVFEEVPGDACVVLQGAPFNKSPGGFRQTSEFYYLTGSEIAHSYLLMDGRTRTVTLYVPERSDKTERVDGPMLGLQDADLIAKASGVDRVASRDAFAKDVAEFKLIYTQLIGPEGAGICIDNNRHAIQNREDDPLDDFVERHEVFVNTLRRLSKGCTIEDIFPVISNLRIVKSPAEIAVMREAGLITAMATNEAMRSTKPGRSERALSAIADYHFSVNSAFGAGYDAIVAGGVNIWHFHYKQKNNDLKDGEMVIFDYAPDLRYYTSDIGRMWPVNGRFTDEQRMYVQYMLDYHKVLEDLIKPGLTADKIHADAAAIMEPKLDAMTFPDPEVEAGFRKTLDTVHLTHGVGMAVHETGKYKEKPLEPGVCIALDPQLWVPEQEIYYRVEDTVIVTETGIENVTISAAREIDDIEAMIAQSGMVDQYPPLREQD